jgi:hypothetical protein
MFACHLLDRLILIGRRACIPPLPHPSERGVSRLAFRGLFRLLDAFRSDEHRLEVRFYYAPLEYASFGFIKDFLTMSKDAYNKSPRTS